MDDVNIVPGFEVAGDFRVRYFISFTQIRESSTRKHHAPAERVCRAVAFINGDVVRGVGLLHEDGEVHARRPAANDADFHGESLSNAALSLSIPLLNNSGSAHMPMRKFCGDSKKRPGTIAVSN